MSKVLCFQEGDQLWRSASGKIMTSQPDYDSEQQRSEAAVSSEQSVGEQKEGEQEVGEQEVAIDENNSEEEHLPDIEFVATTKARSTINDRELDMVGEKEWELGRMLNRNEEEYVKLQVKRDTIVEDYPSAKDRSDGVKKQLKAIQNKINKKLKILNKANVKVCEALELKKVAKSVSQRKKDSRKSQDKDSSDREKEAARRRMATDVQRESDRRRKAANRENIDEEQRDIERESDRRRKATPENRRADKQRKTTKKGDMDADPMDGLRSREILEGSFGVKVNELGKMENRCQSCQAYRFKKETGGVCCLNGKVRLARFSAPPAVFLKLWYEDNLKANVFRKNSRAFNNSLCFSSIKVKEKRFARFTPSVILQGKLYHLI